MTSYRTTFTFPDRITRLDLPERSSLIGTSLRAAERELEDNARKCAPLVDLTYADTARFPAPPWAIKAFTEAAVRGGMSYTPYKGDGEVRERLAPNLSTFLGISVNPSAELILTPGTQAALFAALATIVENGDSVVMVDPDYLANERLLRYFGANVVHIPLTWKESDTTLDLDALEEAFKQHPKAFLFSNPNNPTGTIHSIETIRRIADLATKYDVFVVADELYSRLVYDGRKFHHLTAIDGMRERTITLLGPSKTESMSGYRLGVAVGPRELIDRMEDVQSIAALRAPAYAQRILVHWLKDDHELVAQRVKEYQLLRDIVVRRFQQTEFLRAVPSGGTSYIFPSIVGIEASDQEIALRLQHDAGVIINPGYQSGPRGIGHFRICFAQDETILEQVLDRIVNTLGRIHSEQQSH